jgi:germacradienol/geosmin synthase
MSGILVWHQGCHRYDQASLPHRKPALPRRLGGPTGLGTSAARVRQLVGGAL